MKVPIDDQIRDEKLQYNTNREADKISAWYQAKLVGGNILLANKYYHLKQIQKQIPSKTNNK